MMIRRTNRIALAAMRDVAVVWSSRFDGKAVQLFDTVKLTQITPNDFHLHCIEKMQHCYSMTMVAVGIEPCGRKYIKTEQHVLTEPRKHTSTVEYFNEQHERLLDTINPNHEKGAAWIATIREREFTNDEIIKLVGI